MGVAASHCPVLASLFRDLVRTFSFLSSCCFPFSLSLELFFPLFLSSLSRSHSILFFSMFFLLVLSAFLFLFFSVSALFRRLASILRLFLSLSSERRFSRPLAHGYSRVRWFSLFTAAVSTASSIVARTPALSRGSPHWRVDGGGRGIGSGGWDEGDRAPSAGSVGWGGSPVARGGWENEIRYRRKEGDGGGGWAAESAGGRGRMRLQESIEYEGGEHERDET